MKRRIRQVSILFLKLLLLYQPCSMLQAQTVVLATLNYPPYEFETPQNGLRGFDVEVIEAAFKRVNISTEFKFIPWKRGVEQTKVGKFAGIFSCSHKVEREEFFIFSAPISSQTEGYFVRKDFSGFEPSSLEDAKGLTVAVILGWAMADTMKDAGANIVTFRTEKLVFRDLLKDLIDYAYLSLESSGFGAMKLGITNKIRTIKIQEKKLYVCFSKKWPNIEGVIYKFNEGLAALRKDGSHDRIHARYK